MPPRDGAPLERGGDAVEDEDGAPEPDPEPEPEPEPEPPMPEPQLVGGIHKFKEKEIITIAALLIHAAKIDEIYSDHEKKIIIDFSKKKFKCRI